MVCRRAEGGDASSSGRKQDGAAPQVNGVAPQLGHLHTEGLPPSKVQKAVIPEALLQAAKANGIFLQSHG